MDAQGVAVVAGSRFQFVDVIQSAIEPMAHPVAMTVCSFSVAEEALRRIYRMKELGLVGHVTMVLDLKAFQKTMKIFAFLSNVVDVVRLCQSHAKVCLITDPTGRERAVVSSQNLTRGNRFECAVIIDSKPAIDAIWYAVNDIIDNQSISLYESFKGPIAED